MATPVFPPLTRILNARLPERDGLYQMEIDAGGILRAVLPMGDRPLSPTDQADGILLDVAGDWVSLGGVDLQINGALGLAFPDLEASQAETLVKICRFLGDQGVDGFLPTLVTTSVENIHRALDTIASVQRHMQQSADPQAADILGVHLEGPFLNPEKRGAHPQEHLRSLTLEQVRAVVGPYGEVVRAITLAPELDPTGQVIPELRSLDIIVSLGHSQATEAQAKVAFDQGATWVTHAFNAMPPLHHRQPGLLGAALVQPSVFCGVIADGQHIAPTLLDILMRACRGRLAGNSSRACMGLSGLFLVSDALAPLGLPDGTYPWDSRQIHVQDGTARLPDGTLAGTTHALLVGAQNLVKWGICHPEEAIALATRAPRAALGLPDLEPGQPIRLLRWSLQGDRQLTWQRLFPSPDDGKTHFSSTVQLG